MAIYCGRLCTEETSRAEVARGRLAGSHEPVSSTRLKVSLPMTTGLSKIIRNNRTVYSGMQYFVLSGTDRWRHYTQFNGKTFYQPSIVNSIWRRILCISFKFVHGITGFFTARIRSTTGR